MPRHTTEHEFLLALLRKLRGKSGVSQVELAKRLGVTQQYISRVEAGQRRLDVVEFHQWCKGLGVDSQDVFKEFCEAVEGRRQLWDV